MRMITDCSSITFRIVFITSVRVGTRSFSDGVIAVLLRRLLAEASSYWGAFSLEGYLAESSQDTTRA
jgi:hypothetical protein